MFFHEIVDSCKLAYFVCCLDPSLKGSRRKARKKEVCDLLLVKQMALVNCLTYVSNWLGKRKKLR